MKSIPMWQITQVGSTVNLLSIASSMSPDQFADFVDTAEQRLTELGFEATVAALKAMKNELAGDKGTSWFKLRTNDESIVRTKIVAIAGSVASTFQHELEQRKVVEVKPTLDSASIEGLPDRIKGSAIEFEPY